MLYYYFSVSKGLNTTFTTVNKNATSASHENELRLTSTGCVLKCISEFGGDQSEHVAKEKTGKMRREAEGDEAAY